MVGSDPLRLVTQTVMRAIASSRTIASFTIKRPALGFPAITVR